LRYEPELSSEPHSSIAMNATMTEGGLSRCADRNCFLQQLSAFAQCGHSPQPVGIRSEMHDPVQVRFAAECRVARSPWQTTNVPKIRAHNGTAVAALPTPPPPFSTVPLPPGGGGAPPGPAGGSAHQPHPAP